MFHHHEKKAKPSFKKLDANLVSMVSPGELLADLKRQDLLQKINQASGFHSQRFDALCVSLVHHLINHCQKLPETENSYFSQPGGFLDYALNRTEAALVLFREVVMADSSEPLSEAQLLWLYALFSASMLKEIGKLSLDFQIESFNVRGDPVKTWNPLLESLVQSGSYYRYEFQAQSDKVFRSRLNLLLARLLMPVSGYAWIASNPTVLAVWLALLNEDYEGAGILGALLIRADAIAIQRDFSDLFDQANAGYGGRRRHSVSFVETSPLSTKDKERMVGMEFIQWLTKSLESGRLMINQAPLLMVPGGMLLSSDIFKWFVRESPVYKNWQAIEAGFLSLNFPNNEKTPRGVIFSNYMMAIPAGMLNQHLKTTQLTVSGEWQAKGVDAAKVQAGSVFHG